MQKQIRKIKDPVLRAIVIDTLSVIENSKTAYKREYDNPICKFIPIILEYDCLFKEYYLRSISFDNDGVPFQVAYFFKTREKAMDYITSFSSIKQLTDTTEIVQACTYYWKSYDREL
jgi:ribosomal protein S8